MITNPHIAPRNGLGTAGFVVGLIGLVFSVIPIVGVIAWPLVIIGLVLSAVGLARAAKGVADNRGMAIAGIAVSAIGLLICILWVAAIGGAAQQVEQNELTPIDSAQAPAAGTRTVVFTLTAEKAVNVRYGELGAERSAVVSAGDSWEQAFTFGGGSYFLSLSATAVDSDDYNSPITCAIAVDGTPVAEQSNPFGVACSATVEN